MKKYKLIIIEDDSLQRTYAQEILENEFELYFSQEINEIVRNIDENNIDLALIDIDLGADYTGIDILNLIKSKCPNCVCIMVTSSSLLSVVRESIKQGAACYLKKPYTQDELNIQIQIGIIIREKNKESLIKDEIIKVNRNAHLNKIIGESKAIKQIKEQINEVSQYHNATILITGESGTGKELVARAIHETLKSSSRPFVPVNCAAIPAELLESELFGHEKGSFTGACDRKIGCVELASGGDLFLDEIGELSLSAQAKLLRVIQEREFTRVGGLKPIKSNFRLISATNRDLKKLKEEGKFRNDLYFRIFGYPIHIPPLRERLEDIPFLLEHFIAKQSSRLGKKLCGFDNDLINLFSSMNWEGNVRALKNLIEIMAIKAKSERLSTVDLDMLQYCGNEKSEKHNFSNCSIDRNFYDNLKENGLFDTLKIIEKNIIKDMLMKSRNQSNAAEALKIRATTLSEKIKKYKIDVRELKPKKPGNKGSS
ncbi:MAG: sigma-54 dependent transcriptional regulator [Pseudomonadota bacterium]